MTSDIIKISLESRRELIRHKLLVMQECYKARDIRNYDRFIDAFHGNGSVPTIIGTDSGPWFMTPERVKWLVRYDWTKWGDVSIDPLGFTIKGYRRYDFVSVKGTLDFHQMRVWDLNIYIIFDSAMPDYPCQLMQFTVPRNLVEPTVVINQNEAIAERHRRELGFLESHTSDTKTSLISYELCRRLSAELENRYGSLMDIELTADHIMVHTENDGSFYYAATGVMTERNGDKLPFRLIGVGCGNEDGVNDLCCEISRPFFCEFG